MHWHWHRLWLWLWLALDMCKERPRIGDSLTTRAGKERPSDARTSVSTSVSSATATAYPVLSSPVPSLSRTVLLPVYHHIITITITTITTVIAIINTTTPVSAIDAISQLSSAQATPFAR